MASSPETAMAALGKDANRTLTYQMVEAVGRAIVTGQYANRFPTEAELAKTHGVSRSVTREAMKMIAAKGLLGARPKQGTFVQPEDRWSLLDTDVLRWLMDRRPSIDLLRHFNELRLAVEPQAAEWAAQRANPAQVSAIHAALKRMQEAAEGYGDPLEADIDFHVAILRACGNPFMSQLRDLISTALRTSIRFTNRRGEGRRTVDDHAAVYEAIAAGAGEKARIAMAKLIRTALEDLALLAEKPL